MGMRPAVFVSMVLAGGALVAPATAGAARSVGSREVRPFFDSRAGAPRCGATWAAPAC